MTTTCNVSFANTASTDETPAPSYLDRTLRKLGRGAHDVGFCWGDLIYQMSKPMRTGQMLQGLTAGFFQGLGHTAIRAVVGVYEIATFPIPEEPILNPEFFTSQYLQDG